MRWTERQRAMLRAMGLRVWSAPRADSVADGVAGRAADATAQGLPEADASLAADAGSPLGARFVGMRSGAAQPAAGPGAAAGPAVGLSTAAAAPPPATATRRVPTSAGPGTPTAPSAPTAPIVPIVPILPGAATEDAAADAARAAQIAELDWPALREAVSACRACALCETRRQTVFGVGAEDARWMVVGEAPGEQEDRQGEPFVGPAGRLLDQMLAALDLTRDASVADPAQRVYIANTLKCRPPGNRNPTPQELGCCEPFLQRQIALVRPRVIVAMGRFAVQQLLRSNEAIGRLRGRVHAYQGVPLVVTYHPAYLLRNLPDKARAWQDLCLAAQTMESAGGE